MFLSFNQKPFLVSSKSSLLVGEVNYEVYLDINTQSRLEGLYFICPKESTWFPYFNSLALELERVMLRDIPKVVELWKSVNSHSLKTSLFNLPVSLLDNALATYNGSTLGHCDVSLNLSSNLVCRCFGVYSNQIEDFVRDNEKADLVAIASEFKASVGCGSCSSSVIEIINKAKSKKVLSLEIDSNKLDDEFDSNGNRVLPLGLNPSEFVLKIHSMLGIWKKEQELDKVTIEIVSIKGHTIDFKVGETKSAKYILDTFSDYIKDKLGIIICFNLTL